MKRERLLAVAQLLRLPNVFTAFADIALGACVAGTVLPAFGGAHVGAFLLVALASGCLYLAGMVWNDYCDYAEDLKARAFRPLPSGRVTKRTAVVFGVALFAAGLALAGVAGTVTQAAWNHEPLVFAGAITLAVLVYDGGAKRTPLGPVSMAACRFLNVLLGLSLIPDAVFAWEQRIHLAGVVGIYIVGVTWFARTEESNSRKRDLTLAATVMLLALVLALVLRANLATGMGTVAFPYLLVAFGFLVGVPVSRAISEPSPRRVQSAVKRCVLGLVFLDAVLASMFVGLPGLLLLLLLPPALWLGKWVYST
jgi:4-hydroxybenzoate polyprenyltransferase